MAKSKRADAPKKKEKDNATKSGIMNGISDYITNAISSADETAAAERVARLREARPESDTGELVQILIRNKCLQTGAVGAVTSGSSIVPGLGNLALMFGVAADIGWTFKMQTELVLEIAAAYEHELGPQEKQTVALGKWTKTGAVTTANRASSSTLATGKWAIAELTGGARGAAGAVVGAGKKAGQGVASGADAAAKTVANAGKKVKGGISTQTSKVGQSAARGASAVKKGVSKAGKKISRTVRRKQQNADALDDLV